MMNQPYGQQQQQQPSPTFAIIPPAQAQGYHPQQQPHPTQGYPAPPPPPPQAVPPQQAVPRRPVPPPTVTTTLKKPTTLDDRVLVARRAPDEESADGRVHNREAVQRIRDAWIFAQVRTRQREFTQYKPALLFLGTWNVNAKGKEEPLDEWLGTSMWQRSPQHIPDIVAVGFQEIVDLNAVNVAVDNKTQQRSQFWVERLRATLAGAGVAPYTMLMQKSMVGLLLCVFVRSDHESRIRGVHASAVGVGVLGMGGNKGGVSIRLQYYDTTMCFVCSHLAAHRENVVGRNSDYANIMAKTTFDIGEDAIREVIRSGSVLSNWTMGSASVGLADHDMVFWVGDLNYRIDESMQTEVVLQKSEKGQLDELRLLDQLNVERKAGRVFENFYEGHLSFPPTYKYQPGTDVYDQRPDKKVRAPAWCDRILWRTQEDPHVEQLTYGRSETPNVSDHKAVYSMLRLTVKDVIQAKREAIYDELMKLLDRYENQSLPMIGLDRVSLDFGPIRYEQTLTLPIQITNTGSVVAQYRLVPKPDEGTVCKPWLQVSPMFGMLIPGEASTKIDFTITVNKETAHMLNSGREVLEDILILRLENGRDYYISVRAGFARSCFGISVDELVLYSQPMRNVPIDPIERAKLIETTPATALCVPKELWRVVDAIYEKGIDVPNLFVEPGIPDEILMIRESLDTGNPFGPSRIHSYTDVLISLLSSLPAPIIPTSLFPSTEIDSQNIQLSARRLLEELPPIHYNVFVYVISFLREVLQVRSDRNQLTAAKLARLVCSCMSPGVGLDSSNTSVTKRTGMQLIVLHLLETASI